MRGSNIIPKNISFRTAALILIGVAGFTISAIGDEVIRGYCAEVAEKESSFQNFRRREFLRPYFEDVTEDEGACIMIIQEHFPLLYAQLGEFQTLDLLGNAETGLYDDLTFSPKTLQHIKILGDLGKLFGGLEGLKVVHLGVDLED